MRCSTVTPGKFATFCRNPVSRLNSVDLPEFGGPTIATICCLPEVSGGGKVATEGPWQSSMVWLSQNQVYGGFPAQGDLRPVHAKHPRVAARRRMRPRDAMSRQKPQLHQALRVYVRHIDAFQNPRLALLQRRQIARPRRSSLIETHLHCQFIMTPGEGNFKWVLQMTCN